MSVTSGEMRDQSKAEYRKVLDMLSWASDFGLIDLFVNEDGSFYFTPIPGECDLQHCTQRCEDTQRSSRLTRLLNRVRRR